MQAAGMRQAVSTRSCGNFGRNAPSAAPGRAVSSARRSGGGCVVVAAAAAAAAGRAASCRQLQQQQQQQPQQQLLTPMSQQQTQKQQQQQLPYHHQQQQQQQQRLARRRAGVVCAAAAKEAPPPPPPSSSSGGKPQPEQVPIKLPRTGFFISKTEVPAFIPRDDMMDQLLRWAMIEAEEGGQRNFGMPIKVHQRFRGDSLWGFDLEIVKEGNVVADMSVGFDDERAVRSEWIGQNVETGMPTLEGKQEEVPGKHFEIWKTCDRKVDEDLRATIRAFCTGLVAALNKYYAFGSVFAEEV